MSSARSLPRRTERRRLTVTHARTPPAPNAAPEVLCKQRPGLRGNTAPCPGVSAGLRPAPPPWAALTAGGAGKGAALGPTPLPVTGDSPGGARARKNVQSALANFLSFTKSPSPF